MAAKPDYSAMAAHAGDAERLLKALGNAHRLLLMCRLMEGESSVTELNSDLPISQSALSQHLSVLRRERLVETRRDGQMIYYRLAAGPARKLIGSLHRIYCTADEAKR